MMNPEWERVDELAATLKEQLGEAPRIAVVLGSGLGSVADRLADRQALRVSTLPNWSESTIDGHAGLLHKGCLGSAEVLLQQGRIHLYEDIPRPRWSAPCAP